MNRRRRYKRRSRLTITKFTSYLPDCKKFKLKYTHFRQVAPLSPVSYGVFYYNGNFCTGLPYTGAQEPAGYDMLKSQYSKMLILASSIRVTYYPKDQEDNGPYPIELAVYPVTAARQSAWEAITPSGNKITAIPNLRHRTIHQANFTSRPYVVKNYIKTKKIFGIRNYMFHGEDGNNYPYWFGSTGAPATNYQWFWAVTSLPWNTGDLTVPEYALKVEITYYGLAKDKIAMIDS